MSKPGKTPKGSDLHVKKRGPKPEHLKIGGDWEVAVSEALRKPPPGKKPRSKKRGK